jgi:hypothetical protein
MAMHRLVAILLFGFLMVAPARAQDAIADAAQRIAAEAGGHKLILIGEMHGTREAPQLLAALAEHYAHEGPVTVALEADAGLDRAFEDYLHSEGDAAARAELLAWPFWHVEARRSDGRRNLAAIDLIEALRKLEKRGQGARIVYLVGIDEPPFSTTDSQLRDKAMADRVRVAVKDAQDGRVLVLVGNVHAMLDKPSFAPPEMQTPMGAHLADLQPFSVVLAAPAGQHWACGESACGPVDERPLAMETTRLAPGDAWHLRVVLPGFSLPQLVPAGATTPDAQAEAFFARLRADPEHEWLEASGQAWLAQLPKAARVLIAERALVLDGQPQVQTIAPLEFYAMGMDERGDAAIAELALRGVDTSGFAWGWIHQGVPGLLERRMAGIRKLLRARYPTLSAEQRARADALLEP